MNCADPFHFNLQPCRSPKGDNVRGGRADLFLRPDRFQRDASPSQPVRGQRRERQSPQRAGEMRQPRRTLPRLFGAGVRVHVVDCRYRDVRGGAVLGAYVGKCSLFFHEPSLANKPIFS